MLKFLKSSLQWGKKIRQLFQGKVDESQLEKLEQMFYEADLGAELSEELVDKLRKWLKKNPDLQFDQFIEEIKQELKSYFPAEKYNYIIGEWEAKPKVILIVGVNGNGKTTSCAKLAYLFHTEHKKAILAAADTFRAAAIDQIEIWAQKVGIDLVKGRPQSDPAAVAFDAIQAAISRGKDVVIIDTAGRLHTKTDLMRELEKIRKVCGKATVNAPHETYLVLDATTGQNAIEQAVIFNKYTPITGLILTKLDGSAKGGAVIAIQRKLGIPIRYIGIGEGMEDLKSFNPSEFIDALFET